MFSFNCSILSTPNNTESIHFTDLIYPTTNSNFVKLYLLHKLVILLYIYIGLKSKPDISVQYLKSFINIPCRNKI